MGLFFRRARAEREIVTANLAELATRLQRMDLRVDDVQAEATARQKTLRMLGERAGRTEVTLHTVGTHLANHSAVIIAIDARLASIEQQTTEAQHERVKMVAELRALHERLELARAQSSSVNTELAERLTALSTRLASAHQLVHERAASAEQGLTSLHGRLDQVERSLQHTAAATDVVEARMTMIRVANDVARLDIELRAELAKAVNHVAAMLGETVQPEAMRVVPPAIDLRPGEVRESEDAHENASG